MRGRLLPGMLLLLLSLALALATGEGYQRRGREYVRYEGVGPGYDSTLVVVGGWPAPFLLDKPYLSPVNSVGIVAGLLGEDILRPGALLLDVLFFAAVLGALALGARALRRTRTPP